MKESDLGYDRQTMEEGMDSLNSEQLEAVMHGEGPILVVAGAGTGKTQVITKRIAQLINSGAAKPNEILALTFTDKASAEMEQRIVDQLGYLHNVDVMTFNSFGDKLVRRFSRDIGLSNDMILLSEIQRTIVVSDNLDMFKLNYFSPISRPDKYIADMLAYFSKLKNELIKPLTYLEYVQRMKENAESDADRLEADKHFELASSYELYTKLCRQKNYLDYDDQILLAIEVLETRPNVLKRLQQEIKYFLVDEFQDTNKAQNRLLELLVSSSHNLMVVGDDDQSIYKFRGAAISNILAFKEQYPGSKQVVLTKNYRSSQQILDASYRLIQHNNPERLEVRNRIDKKLVAFFTGDEPLVSGQPDYDAEMNWLLLDISLKLKKGVAAKDIAVLVRKNSQGLLLKRAFERAGVPHRLIGQNQDLYSQPEIQYMLYFFRLLANPNDSTSLYHLLAGEIFAFDVTLLREAVDLAKQTHSSLEKTIRENLVLAEPSSFREMIKKIDRSRDLMTKHSVGEVGFDFLDQSGYVRRLVEENEQHPEYVLKLNHLNQYFKTLMEYERIAQDRSVVGYVDHLAGLMRAGEATDVADVDVMADEVQIMTVHRAKGLEFEAVYIFDLTKGNFPARERGGDIELPERMIDEGSDDDWNKREERRLMYVAMTRAKRYLAMTFSVDHGGKLPHKPSEFLLEATGSEVTMPVRQVGLKVDQLELFRLKPLKTELTPNFWQDDWLVLGVRQIDDYLKCPAEFKWKHILKVPERPSANLAYGNLLHSLAERYHRAKLFGTPLKLSEMLMMLESEWPETGFYSQGIKERSLAQAKQTVARFYRRETESIRIPKVVEAGFSAKLAQPKVIMKGRYDVVYEDQPGEVEIWDYKTGGAGLEDEEAATRRAKESNQLTMYAMAWEIMHGYMPHKLTLDFLDQGLVGTTVKTAKQLERMSEKIYEAAEGIRLGEFHPGSSCFNCSHTNLYINV